ncbi:murein L,D-transpeptidase [Sphingomonas ginkgonis]|uniref:Murein L,D-transpeptidase n=1 Tax=Sphingomonas ginkgonis TaxID=2315330 RepID=A0A429VDY4_9SPHN|nr:murein L,D-transpeptidase [Sphingomonas ginkgonis]
MAPGTPGSPIDGTIFHAQVLLDAAGFPAGPIDGKAGQSVKRAVTGFQTANGLQPTGNLDNPTRTALLQNSRASTVMVTLSPGQVAGPFVNPIPRKPEDQAKLSCLCYRNMLEKVSEEFHTTPATIIALNGPDKMIGAGKTLRLPNVIPTDRSYNATVPQQYQGWFAGLNVGGGQKGDYIVVDKSDGVLRVYQGPVPEGAYSTNKGGKGDSAGSPPANAGEGAKLVAQFNVTMGSSHDPLPLGKWKVPTYSFLPKFHYQPNLFWDAKDKTADDKMLPAGPNGPVGVAWLDLTKEHYGIHGTSSPETIGRAESHGCVRMTNWDVLRLAGMMKPGFTAIFQA